MNVILQAMPFTSNIINSHFSNTMPITEAARLTKFKACLRTTLERSKKEVKVTDIIRECYAVEELMQLRNKNHYEGDNDNKNNTEQLLIDLLEGMLESVNEKIWNEFEDVITAYRLNESFLELDRHVDRMEREDRRLKGADVKKRKMIQAATDMASSYPEGVTPSDLAARQSYELKLKMKRDLEDEILQVEADIKDMRQEVKYGIRTIDSIVQQMKILEAGMARTADICTYGSS